MIFRKLRACVSLLIVFLFWVIVSGCGIGGLSGPSIPLSDLLSAPEKVVIDGREYDLDAFLWRDFMPISPPDGHLLAAVITVTATDSLELPPGLDANRLWVIDGNKVWETEFSDWRNRPRPYQLKKSVGGGPKWGPEIFVDVVVRLVQGDRTYLIKAPDQRIGRTD